MTQCQNSIHYFRWQCLLTFAPCQERDCNLWLLVPICKSQASGLDDCPIANRPDHPIERSGNICNTGNMPGAKLYFANLPRAGNNFQKQGDSEPKIKYGSDLGKIEDIRGASSPPRISISSEATQIDRTPVSACLPSFQFEAHITNNS